MTPRAVVALGIAQCVNWGVLYYAFAVLVLPLQRELGAATWVVTGAFSLALLMSAALAPAIGRWGDRDRGALVMQAGGLAAAALLAGWTVLPGVLALYIVWAGLGLCMAATLYEPAFVIVGRAYEDSGARLRALAAVTLFGGLASTIFLPLTAFLLESAGWRHAVLVLAGLLAASTVVTRAWVFPHLRASSFAGTQDRPVPSDASEGAAPPRFAAIATMFALVSFASAAFTANLVPALGQRGIAPAAAAALGGAMGVMQLPGRALLMNGMLADSPTLLLAISLGLQAGGLGAVAFAPSTLVAGGGALVFALGGGLTTLVRPHLIQTLFGAGSGGYLNGRIARHQQLARAAGPLAIGWLASLAGYAAVYAAVAATLAVIALASQGVLGGIQGLVIEKETI